MADDDTPGARAPRRPPPSVCVRAAIVIVFLMAAVAPAAAHQTSVKPLELAVDGAVARVSVRAGLGDVAEALGLPADATPTPDQITASADRVASSVARWLAVSVEGMPCPAGPARATVASDDARFVDVAWAVTCPREIHTMVLDLDPLFDLDPTQSVLLRLTAPGAIPVDTIVSAAQSPLRVTIGDTTATTAFVRHGIDHILHGYDHVAFVIALLLVVILRRDGTRWHPRRITGSLRATATIVTSFTVAHSLTLIAASMGWVSLPSRWVESAIALSIAYTAVENIVRPDVRWRFALTFGFGLVHGLGFASVLAELLPRNDVVWPLLAFNLGVELGQLLVVIAVLPILTLVCRAAGADRYRRVLMPAASGVIAVLGLLWLLERIGGPALLPW